MAKRKRQANKTSEKSKKQKVPTKNEEYAYLKEKQDPMPEVYTKKPPQPTEKKIGQLTESQVNQFFDKGFVLVKDFFAPHRLDVVREAVNKLVDTVANKLYKAGKIQNKHEDKGFNDRLTHLEKEFKGTAVILHKMGILPKEFQDLWSDEKLLNVAEQLVGPELAGHPVWNLRTKTPHNEQTTVPWHQDNAYLEPCSLEVMQLTAWIPLVDANMVNGCMQVASGGHKKGFTAKHTCCAGGTWYVQLSEEAMVDELGVDLKKDIVTCEVPYGGVLFLNNAVPHQSLENQSEIIRWSLDLRWQKPDKPNGFYSLKDSVLMRTKKDKDYKINWDKMANTDRTKLQMEKLDEDNDDLTPEIGGPWMKRWEIVHHNRHTESLQGNTTSWHKA
uniref:Phytanoyl-CoA dioxygenase-like n=1 Tax=Phallusia mammillata TaxID=59560 RepID=A0A6F9DN13_9ASCI|nr:phytanoyl-CoA dioxygenase-like [Phallusia mammillata]